MAWYLISLADGVMDVSEDELLDVVDVAHVVVWDVKRVGVWVFGGGLNGYEVSVVVIDGVVIEGMFLMVMESFGGFSVVDVPSCEEVLRWVVRIVVVCCCAQEVCELLFDLEV